MEAAVQTVTGPLSSRDLGVTLIHEHLLVDTSKYFHAPPPGDKRRNVVVDAPMAAEYAGLLRNDPFLCRDNMRLDDPQLAIEELSLFTEARGRTIVDPTCNGIGRNPRALREIAQAAEINVVMGSGHYIESFHPAEVRSMTKEQIEERIVTDILEGANGTDIRAGFIGEIGISRDFTAAEEKVLRGAARAQSSTRVPLAVHLPGWKRHATRVLDIVEEEGGNPAATILCHMNPSHADEPYQHAVADRSAWIEYDMIGMDWYYADADEQCPCDEEIAKSIVELVRAGYLGRVLLSSDVFLKMMLVRYGGYGYAHVLKTSFLGCSAMA